MGQILIRGIPDDVLESFKARAQRHGRSQEQEARLVIEDAARESENAAQFAEFSGRMMGRLKRRGGDWSDSTEIIRRLRDRR